MSKLWIRRHESKLALGLILAAHLLVYLLTGFRRGSDSGYYLGAADYLIGHGFNLFQLFRGVPHSPHYASTIVWVAVLGARGFYALSIVFSIAALLCFHRLLKVLWMDTRSPHGAAVFRLVFLACFLSNIEILRWNYYLLSDGLFVSLVLFMLSALLSRGALSTGLFALVAVFFGFARPTAVLALGLFFLFTLWTWRERRGKAIASILVLFLVLGTQVYFGDSTSTKGHFGKPFVQGIVSGHLIADPSFGFKIDSPFQTDSHSITGQENIAKLLLEHPYYSLKYLVAKWSAFVMPVYPYFSWKHRLFNGIYYGILYLLIGMGVLFGVRWKQSAAAKFIWWGVFVFGSFSIFHTFTILDSEARYLSPWVSLLFLSGAAMVGSRVYSTSESRKTRVLHIISELDLGGAELALTRYLEASSKARCEYAVLSLKTEGVLAARLRAAGIPVLSLGTPYGLLGPLSFCRAVIWARRFNPDWVQSWLYLADFWALALKPFLGFPQTWWNIRCSNAFATTPSFRTRLIFKVNAFLSRIPDGVIFNSYSGKAFHLQNGFRPRRVEVIQNGFDLTLKKGAESRFCSSVESIPKKENFIVGSISKLHELKGYRILLEAWREFSREVPDSHLVLVGGGFVSGNPALEMHLQGVDRSRIHLLGEIKGEEIPSVLKVFDLFTLSSISEGFPNVLGEAMAAKIPCVATDVGDVRDLLGDAGRVVPPGDAHALVKAWKEVSHASKEIRVALGQASRSRIEEKFSLVEMVDKYERLYVSAPSSQCPVCGAEDIVDSSLPTTLFEGEMFRYRKCAECGLQFVSPSPTAAILEAMYGKKYTEHFEKDEVREFGSVLEALGTVPQGKKLLDFGCGSAAFLSQVAEKFGERFELTGVEYAAENVTELKRKFPAMRFLSLAELIAQKEKFDIIHFGDVLEHFSNPNEMLAEILGRLTPEGYVLVHGPLEANANLAYFCRGIYFNVRRFLKKGPAVHPPYHTLFFNYRNQRQWLEKHGIRTVRYEVSEIAWPFPDWGASKGSLSSWIKGGVAFLSIRLSRFVPSWGNRFVYLGRRRTECDLI